MKKILLGIFVAILLNGFLSAQIANLQFQPSTVLLTASQPFSVSLNIENVVDLHGYSITVTFPDSLVQCTSVNPGGFLGGGTFFYPTVQNNLGRVIIDEVILGTGSQSGTGILCNLHFMTAASGNGWINMMNMDLRNSINNQIVVAPDSVRLHNGITGQCRVDENQLPRNYLAVYPNPFNSFAAIEFELVGNQQVSVDIFDLNGAHVAKIFSGKTIAGRQRYYWNGKSKTGNSMASGIFFVRLLSENSMICKEIHLIK